MRYLITTPDQPPFFTAWFDPENHFDRKAGMTVYDLQAELYTTDGEIWNLIVRDNL